MDIKNDIKNYYLYINKVITYKYKYYYYRTIIL